MSLFARLYNATHAISPETRDVVGSVVLLAAGLVFGVLALNLGPEIDGCLR